MSVIKATLHKQLRVLLPGFNRSMAVMAGCYLTLLPALIACMIIFAQVRFFLFCILVLLLCPGLAFLLLKRRRLKVREATALESLRAEKEGRLVGKKVLVEKSLYNEIIAAYNIFSHQLESLEVRSRENFQLSAGYALVKRAKYKLMTPGMERNRLLFYIEDFTLIKEGLRLLNVLLDTLHAAQKFSFSYSPDFRLLQRVFAQLELCPRQETK